MSYSERLPPPWLRGAVEHLWTVRVDAGGERGPVLPDGCMDLIWTGTALIVAGPDTAPHPVSSEPGVATGLRFAPGRLPAMLGTPAAALRNERVRLAELLPPLGRGATARLEAGERPDLVLADVVAALPGSPAGGWLCQVVAQTDAGVPVAEIADAVGWTARSLHRHCLTAFGYGPATLRRVLRFRRALALLQAGVPVAQAATVAGYADQPHLSREVREMSGLAPGQLVPRPGRFTT